MKKYIIPIIAIILLFTNCNDNLDNINKNPNAPEFVPPNTIFNRATQSYISSMRGVSNSGKLSLPWMQYWGGNWYIDEDRYQYRETTAQSIWTTSYQATSNLKEIIMMNSNPETSLKSASFGNTNNQIAVCRIMLSYIFQQMTDTFGDVPYYSYGSKDKDFQALNQKEHKQPLFASQKKIYADILKELKAASKQLVLDKPVFTSGDNIYGGDATKWKKFANSLILRVANRLRAVAPAIAKKAIDEAVVSGVFTSNADNAVQKYETKNATASPMWNNGREVLLFAVTQPFVELLKGKRGNFSLDPRLFKMVAPKEASTESIKTKTYQESTDPVDYVGVPYGFTLVGKLDAESYSFASSQIIKPDYGEVLMEYAEVCFILSEQKNWDKSEYEKGVRASLDRWGVSATDATDFVNKLPAANQENVLTQKYIASYMQPHNAWAEYRRTGYPHTLVKINEVVTLNEEQGKAAGVNKDGAGKYTYKFTSKVTGLTDLPSRIAYPQSLQNLNRDNRITAIKKLKNGDSVTSKLYWAKN